MSSIEEVRSLRGGRRRIVFEDGTTWIWPSPVVSRVDLSPGEEVNRTDLREQLRAVAAEILPEKARQYLGRYQQTTARFKEKFNSRGYPEQLVDEIVSELRDEGFLDDEKVARRHVRDRLSSKPRGRAKLEAELSQKGIDHSLASRVVGEELPRDREREMARRYCRDHQELSPRKLGQRLQTRGFPAAVIRDMVDEFGS